MRFLQGLDRVLSEELLTLSGVPVTGHTILSCIVIFVAGLFLSRHVGNVIQRLFVMRSRSPGVGAAVGKIVRYVIVIISAIIALETLGLSLTGLLAGSAVLLVGIGLGLQGITHNFVSGLIVLAEQHVKEGDFIFVGGDFGWVRNIGLRGTRIVTREAVSITIPNSQLVSTHVINHSAPTKTMRTSVSVGVVYEADPALVRDTLLQIASDCDRVLSEPAPEVQFSALGESSLDFELMVWIDEPPDDWRIQSSLRYSIIEVFRAKDIGIAFPQRSIHIRSGLKALPHNDHRVAS